MKRAAIYARFSSDLQNDRSIDDQIAICRAFAERNQIVVAGVFTDRALSGASIHGRLGIQQMIGAARERCFDVVLAETLSRIGRDQEDRHYIRKRLNFLSIDLMTPTDGVVTPLIDGVRGIIDEHYLTDLKVTIRGRMGERVREGLSAGGLAYGYVAVPGQKGALAIVPEQAVIVVRIYTEFVVGKRPRTIAHGLNADGIPPPRGFAWTGSAINGNRQRGSGILGNALYDGRLVWNKVGMRKNPDTGKRVSRPNPESEWRTTAVEPLRIVPPHLFAAAQALRGERAQHRPEQSRRPKHLLSGLLKCGCCGSGMVLKDRDRKGRRVHCSRMKETGRCANGRAFYLDAIERRVVHGLKAELSDPRAIERYLATYREERRRLAAAESGRRAQLEKALAQATRDTDRALNALIKGLASDEELGPRLAELRRKRAEFEQDIAALTPTVNIVALHPSVVETYLAAVDKLAETLSRRVVEGDDEIAAALRDLVVAVIVHPRGGAPDIEIKGRLAALTEAALFPQKKIVGGTLVAEERYRRKPQPGPVFTIAA